MELRCCRHRRKPATLLYISIGVCRLAKWWNKRKKRERKTDSAMNVVKRATTMSPLCMVYYDIHERSIQLPHLMLFFSPIYIVPSSLNTIDNNNNNNDNNLHVLEATQCFLPLWNVSLPIDVKPYNLNCNFTFSFFL